MIPNPVFQGSEPAFSTSGRWTVLLPPLYALNEVDCLAAPVPAGTVFGSARARRFTFAEVRSFADLIGSALSAATTITSEFALCARSTSPERSFA